MSCLNREQRVDCIGDDLVDLVQAERMYTHLCRLYEGNAMGLAVRVVLEDKGVRGGRHEGLES